MIKKDHIHNLMKQAQKMQEKMTEIQKEISKIEVIGESGAGLVKITMKGSHDCKKIEIDKSMMTKNHQEMLEDLIVAAFNDASRRITEEKKNKMSKIPFPNENNSII